MKMYTNSNSAFPSQVVPDYEKASLEYGSQVAQAIETEWFNQGRTNGNRYLTSFKDELSINGDLSYLNLDWKPVPILSKFVDIVVNGISSKEYDIKAYSQDPASVKKRTMYATAVAEDMFAKEQMQAAEN